MIKVDKSKRIRDIQPIENASVEIKRKEDLDSIVEEPLLEPIRNLYDLNINTLMCSANIKDVGENAYIDIEYDALSEQNKATLDLLAANFPNKFQKGKMHGSKPINTIQVRMPISTETTVGEVTEYFNNTFQALQVQDITYGVFDMQSVKRSVAATVGIQESSLAEVLECSEKDLLKECASILGVSEYEGKYYTEEALRRHLVYVNSKENSKKEQVLSEKNN